MRSRQTDPAKLQALREDVPLTQEALADLIGVDRTAVSKWESPTAGKAPSPQNFKKLCATYAELVPGFKPEHLLVDKAAVNA